MEGGMREKTDDECKTEEGSWDRVVFLASLAVLKEELGQ